MNKCNSSEQVKETLHSPTGRGKFWLCRCIRRSLILSSLGTELRASVAPCTVSTTASYLAIHLVHYTQHINCSSQQKEQTTAVSTGTVSCSVGTAHTPLRRVLCCGGWLFMSNRIGKDNLIRHLSAAFLKEI